ncbi:uncharacterized protein MAM_01368 [Metarhizium album ARSEF 1941]|uniref:Uncharacterized protein n=1 Tax=Metarhizium album (strain ARSEF 1941) TaxID=1081103 RepID=A0A0B2X560_METAS|nr:uncharacterized protein MAM_01368 [Metarhizium album ARSEF 1941]KHO00590.1 hypothetical protein MAM_01368 [Metarhizium album ARSEF 1941]
MPTSPRVQHRTIEVDEHFFPSPATKLVVTQYLAACDEAFAWAWIIVGAFYDRHGRPLWSTEVLVCQINDDSDSDGFDSTGDPTGDSADSFLHWEEASVSVTSSAAEGHVNVDLPISLAAYSYLHPAPTPSAPIAAYIAPPIWDPVSQGPVPGHWQASFDISACGMSGGWNPVTGRDPSGTRPNFAPYGAPAPSQGQPYIFHTGGPGQNFGTVPHYNTWAGFSYTMHPLASPGVYPAGYVPHGGPAGGYYTQQTFSYQPNGTGNILPRQPQPWPAIDPTMPAAQMTNSTGGVGCEPGYNLFFAAEHTKAHVFRSNIPPWQLPATAQLPFKAVHIPCNTTVEELLKGFGCTNPVPKKNKVFEMQSAGGGKWYKGLEVNGANKDLIKKTIKELGWDATRTGNPREKPVVRLWFCKD